MRRSPGEKGEEKAGENKKGHGPVGKSPSQKKAARAGGRPLFSAKSVRLSRRATWELNEKLI